jgi:hypothetical protein
MINIGDTLMFHSGFNEPDYAVEVRTVHEDGTVNVEALDSETRHGGHYLEVDITVVDAPGGAGAYAYRAAEG